MTVPAFCRFHQFANFGFKVAAVAAAVAAVPDESDKKNFSWPHVRGRFKVTTAASTAGGGGGGGGGGTR